MTDETLEASTTIAAPAEAVFAVLTDPASHPAIDGTGWVSKALDTAPLTGSGQIVPDGDVPRQPPGRQLRDGQPGGGVRAAAGDLLGAGPGHRGRRGAAVRRLDLALRPGSPGPSSTEVTLTYDWSAVPSSVREHITFPPFPVDHLTNSLRHLAELATRS